MKRRTFLLVGATSTATLLSGGAALRVSTAWWDQPPSQRHRVLSRKEAAIVEAIAEAMFPGDDRGMPSGDDVDVVGTADEYLASIPSQKSRLLRALLHAIDELAMFSNLGMKPFHRRPVSERIDILNAWDDSLWGMRREAFSGLKMILSMGYCESPRVLRAAGIDYECGDWQ